MPRVVVTDHLILDGVMQARARPTRTTEVLNVQNYVAPTTLAEPLPLFPDGMAATLRLVDSVTPTTGMASVTYQPTRASAA